MTKNELPGNRVAYASGEVAGEGSLDRNQQLTEISLPHSLPPASKSHQYVYETTKVGSGISLQLDHKRNISMYTALTYSYWAVAN
jgi:hypothetical protein